MKELNGGHIFWNKFDCVSWMEHVGHFNYITLCLDGIYYGNDLTYRCTVLLHTSKR